MEALRVISEAKILCIYVFIIPVCEIAIEVDGIIYVN